MAVSSATELKILVKTAGEQNLNRLSRQLEGVGKNTASADFKFDKFSRALKRQEQRQRKTSATFALFLVHGANWQTVSITQAKNSGRQLVKQKDLKGN